MSDLFEALISAKFDDSSLDRELNRIGNKQVTLKNIQFDVSTLQSQLQSALSKQKFNINLNTGAMQKSGQQAGKMFASALESQLNNIHLKNGSIGNVKNMLQGAGFDKSSIAAATKDLDKMVLTIEKLTTRQMKNGNISMNIAGVDELGRSVSIVREFDKATGQVANTTKTFTQNFGNSAKAAREFASDLQRANTAMQNGSSEASLARVNAQYEKLRNTGHSSLSQIQADLQQLRALQDSMGASGSDEELVANYKKFEEILARTKNKLSEVSSQSKMFASSLQVDTLDNKMSNWLEKNSRASRDFGASINELRSKLASLKSSGKATTSELNAIEQEFKQIQQQAIAAGKVGVSFGNSLKGAFASLTRYISVSTIIYRSIAALKEMYQNVYDIDTEMTELKKVTDETAESYKNFLSGSGQVSQEIGTTIKDLVSSTADFARLGYSFGDSQELAKVANMYNVVGDEIEGIDEATKSVISTMAAFNSEMDETTSNGEFAMGIIDKFNEVGNNFAISSGGIGEALTRSASSMAAANNTLDETIALITAANTVVQNPESIGTAYKTISMRIRGAKTELEQAGLETDGMVESTAKLREEIEALSGVDIMKDENTFKSTYQIMKELANEWENLTDIQQASITELIAGKRQGNIVSALMSNFDIAENALETSINSEGSAAAEHAKWMESMEAKTKQFQAAWENLSQTLMNSDFLKGMIDKGTGFLNILDGISKHIGTLPIAAAGVGLGLFIKNFD